MKDLPDLDEMTDDEAVSWYTGEVLRITTALGEDPNYLKALNAWKEQLNARLKENRLKGW